MPSELFTGEQLREDHILKFFIPNPNLTGFAADIAANFGNLAHDYVNTIPRSPERTAGLRKLLEAKDCFIRAQLV